MATIPLVLPLDRWPESDQTLWLKAVQHVGLFGDGGSFAQLSAGSLQLYQQGYAQWLSFLARTCAAALEDLPHKRITPERVKEFIAEAQSRGLTDRTIATLLMSLLKVNQAFGGGWPTWLHTAQKRIYRASNPSALKKPPAIGANALYAWSLRQIDDLTENPLEDWQAQAVAWRQALMVGIQIACPVRLRAMVAMTVDEHVVWVGENVLLRWQAADMKDKKARDMPLPAALGQALKAYILGWRPMLLMGQKASNALWISRDGKPLCADSYQSGLAKLTKRELGVALRPHAFRHIAATSIAEHNPAEAGIIRDVLGHATIRTSEMYYNRASMRQATAKLQVVVDRVRKSARLREGPKLRLTPPRYLPPDPDEA